MTWTCRLCSKQFSEIPKTATAIGAGRRGHRNQLWSFPDGTTHDLVRDDMLRRPGSPGQYRSACTRWHRQRGVVDRRCKWCRMDADEAAKKLRPPQIPLPVSKPTPQEPKVEQVLTEVLNVAELPTPQPELSKPERITVESKPQSEPETTMAAAFKRFKR